MQRGDVYFQNPQVGGASARESEILAFGLCNNRLSKATDARSRIEALQKTHQLWSLLVCDLSSEDNQLPKFLKDDLTQLGFWAMRYCIASMSRDLTLQPLIDVNQNILEGLRMQAANQQAASSAAPTSAPQAFAAISG